MSMLLYVLGILACLAGALTIAFGISIELSFGNALIIAGTSAVAGGLIVIGLGAVVSQLRRLVEALGERAPLRPGRTPEPFEVAGGRIPFPPRSKPVAPHPAQPPVSPPPPAAVPSEPPAAAPATTETLRAEEHFVAAPTLPNPEEAPVEVHEEVSVSPLQPVTPPAPAETGEGTRPPFAFGAPAERPPEPEAERRWRLPPLLRRAESAPPRPQEPAPPPSHFDTMWPPAQPARPGPESAPEFESRFPSETEAKAEATVEPAPEPVPEPEPEPKAVSEKEPAAEPPSHLAAPPATPEAPPPAGAGEPRAVAILKSGVVDGMGYTLYVDGSIEAELPQGALRFSSINDLRDYLEKSGQS